MQEDIPQEPLNNPDLTISLEDSPQDRFSHMAYTVMGIVVVLSVGITFYLLFGKPTGNNQLTENKQTISITPVPSASVAPSIVSPTATQVIEKNIISPTPTASPKISVNPTATPIPTNTPTPTPTRTPNPPQVSISFPTEGQVINASSGTTSICVADSPHGGDLTGAMRKQYANSSSWSAYAPISGFCFTPIQGQNTIGMQYKNQSGDESSVVYRNFTYDFNN